MVSIVIMMVGMLGLLVGLNVATEMNIKNHLRDEAVYVGEKYLNELRGQAFSSTAVTYPLISTASKVRGTGKKLKIETSSTPLATNTTSDTSSLLVVVKWTYKGVEYQNRVSAVVSNSK